MSEPLEKRTKMNIGDGSNDRDDYASTIQMKPVPKASEIADLSDMEFLTVKEKLTHCEKTKYIKTFFTCGGNVVQVTAPSRFGKTTFMDTVKTFSNIPKDKNRQPILNPKDGDMYNLFMASQLGIEDSTFVEKHCGQYPVISLSLKDVGCIPKDINKLATEVEQRKQREEQRKLILKSLKKVTRTAFQEHYSYLVDVKDDTIVWKSSNLLKSPYKVNTYLKYTDAERKEELDECDVSRGLKFLSDLLYTHFDEKKKVIILIDECDAPIMKALHENMDDDVLKYLIECISHLMSATLKDRKKYVEKALLNSCVRLSGVFSWQLRNSYDAPFLQDPVFSKVYGFTHEEVTSLFDKAEFEGVRDLDGIQNWYDGYRILYDEKTSIYSSWSIINYLIKSITNNRKMFDSYWGKTGFVEIFKNLFAKPEIYDVVGKLLNDETITIKDAKPTVANILMLKNTIQSSSASMKLSDEQIDFFFQLLWDDGLLNCIGKKGYLVTLKIPNHEIKKEIELRCYTTSMFVNKYRLNIKNINRYINSLKCLLTRSDCESNVNEMSSDSVLESNVLELANGISALFSDVAAIPQNESELHHILFYLPYQDTSFNIVQGNRSVVLRVAEAMNANLECSPMSKSSSDTEHTRASLPHKTKVSSKPQKSTETRGRKPEFDILIILERVGIIIDLKYSKEGEKDKTFEGLKQIFDKRYFRVFDKEEYKDVIKEKIYVCACFKANANVSIRYVVNDLTVAKIQAAKLIKSSLDS